MAKNIQLAKYRFYREKNLARIPAKWFVMKKKHKALIKRKTFQAQRDLWQHLITTSKLNDSASFWRIVARGFHNHSTKLDSYISANTWK